MKRVVPYTADWERKANNEARSYCPSIKPCVHCGNPVISGYCCHYCGSGDPLGTKEEREEFYRWYTEQENKKLQKSTSEEGHA